MENFKINENHRAAFEREVMLKRNNEHIYVIVISHDTFIINYCYIVKNFLLLTCFYFNNNNKLITYCFFFKLLCHFLEQVSKVSNELIRYISNTCIESVDNKIYLRQSEKVNYIRKSKSISSM